MLRNTFLSLKANSSLSDALNSLEIDSDGKFLFARQKSVYLKKCWPKVPYSQATDFPLVRSLFHTRLVSEAIYLSNFSILIFLWNKHSPIDSDHCAHSFWVGEGVSQIAGGLSGNHVQKGMDYKPSSLVLPSRWKETYVRMFSSKNRN